MQKLEENKSYIFKLGKIMQIADENFLSITDPLGKKHLIDLRYYKDYNFEENSEMLCFVDKINCRGQIFIEPDHPFYKRESIHEFEYQKKTSLVTKQGKKIEVIVVKDKLGRDCTILPNNIFQMSDEYSPEKIKCKVERVKKSRLYLVNLDYTDK